MLVPELVDRFPLHDFERYHRRELPGLLRGGRGALAAADEAPLGGLAFRVPGSGAFGYRRGSDGIEIFEGEAAAETVVELDAPTWSGLVHDLESAPGLLYSGRCKVVRGDPMRFVRWEPRLRALYHGRPFYDPACAGLCEPDGTPLDPRERFALPPTASTPSQARDGARRRMAWFLRTAGYLVVRDVFSHDEVAALHAEAEALRRAAREGDRQSWWARDARGRPLLARVINAGTRAPLAALYRDERILDLVSLSEHDLVGRSADEVEAVSVLWKHPMAREGLADLPWHRDCGMGGHALMCPILIVTINLRAGNARSGQLRMLPGSQHAAVPFFEADDPRAPAGVGLDVDAGDVSLHYGDVMHAAPPPRGEGPCRESLLLAFTRRGEPGHHRGEGAYNDVLLGREDGQVEHLAAVARRHRHE